jgi:protein-disulfide isomerase/peroxiredoxin
VPKGLRILEVECTDGHAEMSMLQPGARAPEFTLSAAARGERTSLRDYAGKRVVLLFLPSTISQGLREQLERYQEGLAVFAELNAQLLAISEPTPEAPQLQAPFALLADPGRATWRRYAGEGADSSIRPTAVLIDEEGTVRAVYQSDRYPHLPGPQALARGIRKMHEVPRPAPVTREDWRLGPLGAQLTLIEYSDYQCPHCVETSSVLAELAAGYGDRLLLVHRHFPLRQGHPLAQKAAEAAEAAGAQGKFWQMHHRLFAARGDLERARLLVYASEIGLDVQRFAEELDSGRHEEAVSQDFRAAVACGVRLPPTLFVNGILFEGPRTLQALRARVDGLAQTGG